MLKSLVPIIVFICFPAGLFAQTTQNRLADTVTYTGTSDTVLYIHDVAIPADSVNAWKNASQFTYIKHLEELLDKKQQEQAEIIRMEEDKKESFLQKLLNTFSFRLALWCLAIVFVLVILYNLLNIKGVFRSKTRSMPVEVLSSADAVVSEREYDQLISRAKNEADYRLAVRYLYLKALAKLSENGYLQLIPGKTNEQYVQELDGVLKPGFASLLRMYEFVWYGNFNITNGPYEEIEKQFNGFYNKINNA